MATTEPIQCAALPSSSAAYDLIHRGSLTDLISVAATAALRAGLIGGGLYLYDSKDKKIIQKAVVASLAIEAFVLGYVYITTKR